MSRCGERKRKEIREGKRKEKEKNKQDSIPKVKYNFNFIKHIGRIIPEY